MVLYRVQPNGNYNVVISDLGITVSAVGEPKLLTPEEVNSSNDLHRLVQAGYLLLSEYPSTSTVESTKQLKTETAFVAHETPFKNPGDVFVAHEETVHTVAQELVEMVEEGQAHTVDELSVQEVTTEVTPESSGEPEGSETTTSKAKSTAKKSNKSKSKKSTSEVASES